MSNVENSEDRPETVDDDRCWSPAESLCWSVFYGRLEHQYEEDADEDVGSAERLVDLKGQRDFEHTRKMFRKSSEWKIKHGMKGPVPFHGSWYKQWRDAEIRDIRPRMTMHVRGGWQIKLEDDGAAKVEETDWVAEVKNRPVRKEVALVDLAKPAKPRRHRQKAGDFEFVQGSRSVIALDDHAVPEPEPDEPWEYLDSEDDDLESQTPRPTYAEVAASFA